MDITATRHGLRLSQHGVVISEMRTAAGPTHSVFDVLAALVPLLAPRGRVGVLGLLPEKLFKELPRFDAQPRRQVLGVMELRPVALVAELPD